MSKRRKKSTTKKKEVMKNTEKKLKEVMKLQLRKTTVKRLKLKNGRQRIECLMYLWKIVSSWVARTHSARITQR
jgi:hypothetical protein